MKHLNRLEQVMLAQLWHTSKQFNDQFDDFIVCDAKGYIIETSHANIGFIDDKNKLYFPSHGEAGVCGIMRFICMQAWVELGYPIRIQPIHRNQIVSFRHCFITNALRGITPVHVIQDVTYDCAGIMQCLQSKIKQIEIKASWKK